LVGIHDYIPSASHTPRHCHDEEKKIQDLKQGSMSLSEYITRFNQLSHYAPGDVDTDEKKQDYFLNRLNDGLTYALEAHDFKNFHGMVNKVLVLETAMVQWSARESKSASTRLAATPDFGLVHHL
jgi:D-lyxose ketol-isomerase